VTEKPADVRLAVPADRPALVELTTLLHAENGLFSLSLPKRDALLDRYYDQKGSIIGVIGEVGEPIASIYLALTQPEYTDDWAIVEVWNFVSAEHRHSTHAKHLIEYAKFVSTEMRLPLMIGILSNHRTEAKVRLYERTLDKVGAYFVWNYQFAGGTGWSQ
jgi:hypothetical protein